MRGKEPPEKMAVLFTEKSQQADCCFQIPEKGREDIKNRHKTDL